MNKESDMYVSINHKYKYLITLQCKSEHSDSDMEHTPEVASEIDDAEMHEGYNNN